MLNTSKLLLKFLKYVFFKKFDFDPDLELDPDPELDGKSDPEKIIPDPTHCI